jgi:Zn finger protein HypA/HybF involved in hydrogenase expression
VDERYEVINFQQSPGTTERNAKAIADLVAGTVGEFPSFFAWCLECDHSWEAEGEQWGYAKQCPQCGSWETRS